MKRWHRLQSAAWEFLVFATLVGAAFFIFFDPRLRGAEEDVPAWLSHWAVAYGAGLVAFWLMTALVLTAHAYLLRRSQHSGAFLRSSPD